MKVRIYQSLHATIQDRDLSDASRAGEDVLLEKVSWIIYQRIVRSPASDLACHPFRPDGKRG
jgi:hypothetical protein